MYTQKFIDKVFSNWEEPEGTNATDEIRVREAFSYVNRKIRELTEGIEYKVPTEREMIEEEVKVYTTLLELARKRLEEDQ